MEKSRIILLLIILVYGLVGALQAQTRVFSEAKGAPATGKYYDFEKWSFSIGKDKYEITNKGRGKRISGKNRVTKFRLLLEGAEIIDRIIYFTEYKGRFQKYIIYYLILILCSFLVLTESVFLHF